MYAWKFSDMPADPVFPADLARLGYMVTAGDQIRQILNPEEGFKFKINRNDRFNIKNREAMNESVRNLLKERVLEAGMEFKRLPLDENGNDATTDKPHVPILVSKPYGRSPPPTRILFLVGDPDQDLGVWSHRGVGLDGINKGTVVNFVKAVLDDEKSKDTLLILANPGHLIWHPATGRAMTIISWDAMDRPHGPSVIAPIGRENRIPRNEDHYQHVQYIFEEIIKPNLGADTRVGIMCVTNGARSTIAYLKGNWPDWRKSIAGICFGDPLHAVDFDVDTSDKSDPESFAAFLAARCRAYVLSAEEVGSHEKDTGHFGCNCYSSSEAFNSDCIMIGAWKDMLARLNIYFEEPGFSEPELVDLGENTDASWDMEDEILAECTQQSPAECEPGTRQEEEGEGNTSS